MIKETSVFFFYTNQAKTMHPDIGKLSKLAKLKNYFHYLRRGNG